MKFLLISNVSLENLFKNIYTELTKSIEETAKLYNFLIVTIFEVK